MYNLNQAITDFLLHCKHEKGLSVKTIKFYGIDLSQFENFVNISTKDLELNKITKDELRQYLQILEPLKPKTIKRKIATLKAFFNSMEFEDKILVSPFRKFRVNIKEPKLLPKTLNKYEVKSILKIVYKQLKTEYRVNSYSTFEYYRNIAVIELLFATGIRVSELSNLKQINVDLKQGWILVDGKGSKERIIHIGIKDTISTLKNYAERIPLFDTKRSGYFFINRLGGKLSDQSIRSLVVKTAKMAEIKFKVTPHVFRHTFATLLLENDVDIKYIQSFLGHSSIITTQIYTHVSKSKQEKILRTKHPRKDICL